jgi:hypothetical protein
MSAAGQAAHRPRAGIGPEGGGLSTGRRRSARSTFGRGRTAAFLAGASFGNRLRRVVVKARVVRQNAGASAPRSAHLRYLQRDGVSKDDETARMFGSERQDGDSRAFANSCEGDRHYFRFIVSPDDALEMTHLCAFTRDLMSELERDLNTKLDWTAVDHWNTEHAWRQRRNKALGHRASLQPSFELVDPIIIPIVRKDRFDDPAWSFELKHAVSEALPTP